VRVLEGPILAICVHSVALEALCMAMVLKVCNAI